MTTLPDRTDVLIVGAGPTGLTLANALAVAGIDHLLVDRLERPLATSRAAGIHAHTLEVLSRLDLASPLAEAGHQVNRFAVRDRDRRLLEVRFDTLPTDFPYVLMLPQERTEHLLAEALRRRGGTVHRGVHARGIDADHDGAVVELATGRGIHRVGARHVVGADGMHSLVRERAGIEFPGGRREESFVLADVDMDWPFSDDEVSLCFSPGGLAVIAPLPEHRHRIVATMADPPAEPTAAQVQDLLDARGPSRDVHIREVLWGSRFRIHHRLAGSYRAGPLLLMGDAAHVHSPAGGQGMNTGLIDAVLLGEALAAARIGNERVLDRYGLQRRPAAAQVLRLADRLTTLAVMRSPVPRMLRNLMMRAASRLPSVERAIAMNLSGISRRAASAPIMLRTAIADRRPRAVGA